LTEIEARDAHVLGGDRVAKTHGSTPNPVEA
jgi:hypothetical protein